VLAGVVEVDDVGGLRERGGGEVPDPGGAVADDGELADVVGAAADALGFDQVRERGGGLEGGDVAGRGPVADGVSLRVEFVLGEEDGELDAGAGAAVLALALAAGGSLLVMGTPVPSMTMQGLSAAGPGASGPACGRRSGPPWPARRQPGRHRTPQPPARRA